MNKCIKVLFSAFYLIILLSSSRTLLSQSLRNKTPEFSFTSFPLRIDYEVKPHYRHRADGRPGREIIIAFIGGKFTGKGVVEVECMGSKESAIISSDQGIDTFAILLPAGAGVDSACTAVLTLSSGKKKVSCNAMVPPQRQWTVYIYPHSHVDIGYTNTQENVELIHKRNLLYGIDLARKTADYPEGARYLWNPEVLWPVERYLLKASPGEKDMIREAVRKGYLHLDAGYVHTNTSAAAGEELFEFFRQRKNMEDFTGVKIRTLVQVDIPGMSWGVVPVASQLGIKYCFALNNGSDRVGNSTDLSFKPFWWLGPDGKSKLLFLQPGSYNPGAILKGYQYWPLMAGQTDTSKLLKIVKTENPRSHFIDDYLDQKLPELEQSDFYPYDIFAMTWAMADNTPIDADLPEAVKSWNEDYAFPHLVIASATDIMRAFEEKYGPVLPEYKGDFTEYWTDGLGTAARQTSMNRTTKERLIQSETLWSMLKPETDIPRKEFSEAWRNVIMGTEHTWCFMDPSRQPITDNILAVKFGFFDHASDLSLKLLRSALAGIRDTGSKYIGVFNTLQYDRSGLVFLPAGESGKYESVYDENGNKIPSQRLSTGELVFLAKDVPGFGSARYVLSGKGSTGKGSMAGDNYLDNGIVRVEIDRKTGDIISLIVGSYDYACTGNVPGLNSFRYLHGDDDPVKASGTSYPEITVRENGPLIATLRIENTAEGCRSLAREITVIAGLPYIEISNTVDKIAVTEKEGIHFGFGFNIPDPVTHADIPWGIIEVEKDQLPAGNRNWITFQRWLDISGNNHGITFCSLDAPVFESGAITANILGAATNSPRWIRKLEPSPVIWSWALNNHWHTNFPLSQEGIINYRYRILPHASGYDPSESDRFGLEQAQPLVAVQVKEDFRDIVPMLSNSNNNVVITILKNENDTSATTIRLRSVSGKEEKIKLDWPGAKPASLAVELSDGNKMDTGTDDEISVPANGFVSLLVKW